MPSKKMNYSVFKTALGWMALAGQDELLFQLAFGHETSDAALKRFGNEFLSAAQKRDWYPDLRRRLADFADGAPSEFMDVAIDNSGRSAFTAAVIEGCRHISYGQTLSYGNLAADVDAPRAGRAVGNVMRSNRIPLVIPCHRVVHGNGKIGHFSAPQGTRMKERLLRMEAQSALVSLKISG